MRKFEHKSQPVIRNRAFLGRLFWHFMASSAFLAFSLGLGMVGYRLLNLSWTDAFYNAAMILTGMGPTPEAGQTHACKIFTGFYALYSGLAFLAIVGLLIAPLLHRLLNKLHLEIK